MFGVTMIRNPEEVEKLMVKENVRPVHLLMRNKIVKAIR
jgi:hypothetical protein